jgi:glycine cleavage system H lipoate-binding protein
MTTFKLDNDARYAKSHEWGAHRGRRRCGRDFRCGAGYGSAMWFTWNCRRSGRVVKAGEAISTVESVKAPSLSHDRKGVPPSRSLARSRL